MKLYKKDSSGKIRYLDIIASGDSIVQRSGVLDTENEVEHIKKAKPKNIGKTNETTAEQQAILEVGSIIKSKLQEGYFKTIKESEDEIVISPMLAKNYNDEKHKIDWDNCYIQPKLDGQRCLAHCDGKGIVKLVSRDGRLIENMDHISDELSKNIKEEVILDGELYAYGLSFQENMKLIKKYRRGETENIKFHVYDRISDLPFLRRNAKNYLLLVDFKTCELVDTLPLEDEGDLQELHSINISNGYEGSIIRYGNEGYKVNARSSNLLKYKDFKDVDLPIFDITPNEANPKHGTPHFNLRGKLFKAGVKMSHEDREDLLINKDNYIGKIANIRYFELTDDGILRFPVMVGIHEDR